MKLHREGYLIITIAFILVALLEFGNYALFEITGWKWLLILIWLLGLTLFVLVVQFFRIPNRKFTVEENDIICPADGKVVVIEEVEETEYFKDKRIQVSIFMSPLNVHANYNPISGIVKYVKYHKGLFLVAWHPKSSTDNERSTVVTEHKSGKEVLFRQIAGAVARRICYYVQENQDVKAGEEYGFIKFGSRIDLFLPLDSTINVKIGDVVKGRVTKIGKLN
jgi:phosphatidylserine decarboxylase